MDKNFHNPVLNFPLFCVDFMPQISKRTEKKNSDTICVSFVSDMTHFELKESFLTKGILDSNNIFSRIPFKKNYY